MKQRNEKRGSIMKNLLSIGFLMLIMLSVGCTQNLPMSTTLNDFILMGTRTNSSDKIKFEFETFVPDGQMKVYTKNKVKETGGKFTHTESTALKTMLNDYMFNKFSQFDMGDDVIIKVILKDFWIEQYITDSGGTQAIKILDTILSGTAHKSNYLISAKLKIQITVIKDGKENVKMIMATSDGTSYSQNAAPMAIHGENVNKVNNKAIMLINSYFEEIGL